MSDLQQYLKEVTDFGFEQALHENFSTKPFGQRYNEQQFVFWHPRGLLLAFHTYGESRVNCGNVYYNWRPNPSLGRGYVELTSSGGMRDGVWVGDHDCRSGMLYGLRGMIDNGEFLPLWEQPHISLWLLNYSEHDEPDLYDIRIAERISKLPRRVRNAIAVSAERYRKGKQ